jgi:hypothetical protein
MICRASYGKRASWPRNGKRFVPTPKSVPPGRVKVLRHRSRDAVAGRATHKDAFVAKSGAMQRKRTAGVCCRSDCAVRPLGARKPRGPRSRCRARAEAERTEARPVLALRGRDDVTRDVRTMPHLGAKSEIEHLVTTWRGDVLGAEVVSSAGRHLEAQSLRRAAEIRANNHATGAAVLSPTSMMCFSSRRAVRGSENSLLLGVGGDAGA